MNQYDVCASSVTINKGRVECQLRNSWHRVHVAEIISDEGKNILVSWYERQPAEFDLKKYEGMIIVPKTAEGAEHG